MKSYSISIALWKHYSVISFKEVYIQADTNHLKIFAADVKRAVLSTTPVDQHHIYGSTLIFYSTQKKDLWF